MKTAGAETSEVQATKQARRGSNWRQLKNAKLKLAGELRVIGVAHNDKSAIETPIEGEFQRKNESEISTFRL